MRSKHRVQLKDTLRKDYKTNRKSNKVIEESLEKLFNFSQTHKKPSICFVFKFTNYLKRMFDI